MQRLLLQIHLALLCLVCLACFHGAACGAEAGPTGEGAALLRTAAHAYAPLTSYRDAFTLTVRTLSGASAEVKTGTGRLAFTRPSEFLFEMKDLFGLSISCDGTTLTQYLQGAGEYSRIRKPAGFLEFFRKYPLWALVGGRDPLVLLTAGEPEAAMLDGLVEASPPVPVTESGFPSLRVDLVEERGGHRVKSALFLDRSTLLIRAVRTDLTECLAGEGIPLENVTSLVVEKLHREIVTNAPVERSTLRVSPAAGSRQVKDIFESGALPAGHGK